MIHNQKLLLLLFARHPTSAREQQPMNPNQRKLLTIMLTVILLFPVSGTSAPAKDSAPEPSGRILQYGLYTLVRGGSIIDNPRTTTGKSVSKAVITRDRTVTRIPLVRNKYMAYQFRLSHLPGKGRIKLRRVLKHPPFKLPDGHTSTGSDFSFTQRLERGEVFGYDAYALNEDYEMVEGEWIFQIWFQGKKLVQQRFITYTPGKEEMKRLTAPSWLDKQRNSPRQ